MGNHEVMNMMGDLRYVTPGNYASFADANSEKRQKAAYDEYVKWKDSHASLFAELPQPMEMTEAEWMARHPAGFVEQREALVQRENTVSGCGDMPRWPKLMESFFYTEEFAPELARDEA